MAGRGLRSVLQPVLFLGIASLLHALLFLIPEGGPVKVDPGTSRGIRVKTYVEGPPAAPRPVAAIVPPAPTASADRSHSVPGEDAKAVGGQPRGGESGSNGGPYGSAGPSQGPTVGSGGTAAQSEFGQYLARLRSDEVQGFARKSAKASRQGWKGSGAGSGGWGAGSGTGSGSGAGPGVGSGGGAVGAYVDPRVRMVVIRYPIDENNNSQPGKPKNLEGRFKPVAYPDLKIKKSRFTSGWWNVYIELWTTRDGRIERYDILRPETKGPQEKVFIDQVTREMERWTFEPGRAEIHVDVRFYVE